MRQIENSRKKFFHFLALMVFILLGLSFCLLLLSFNPLAELLGVVIYLLLGGLVVLKLFDYVKEF